jgi:hypothetical protein
LVTARGAHHVVCYHQMISVGISDPGIGVTPEVTDKIFKYGFGAKPQQSGFGLHECANDVASNCIWKPVDFNPFAEALRQPVGYWLVLNEPRPAG